MGGVGSEVQGADTRHAPASSAGAAHDGLPGQCLGRGLQDGQARLGRLDNVVSPSTPEAFAARVRAEHAANARGVREAGIQLD